MNETMILAVTYIVGTTLAFIGGLHCGIHLERRNHE